MAIFQTPHGDQITIVGRFQKSGFFHQLFGTPYYEVSVNGKQVPVKFDNTIHGTMYDANHYTIYIFNPGLSGFNARIRCCCDDFFKGPVPWEKS
jgi:hypothetical protein